MASDMVPGCPGVSESGTSAKANVTLLTSSSGAAGGADGVVVPPVVVCAIDALDVGDVSVGAVGDGVSEPPGDATADAETTGVLRAAECGELVLLVHAQRQMAVASAITA